MENYQHSTSPQSAELVRHIRKNVAEFDRLEGNIISASGGQIPQSLLVTSCNPGEGKTTSSAVIGASIAARGAHNVLLVDGHLRKPRLHKMYGFDNDYGLAEVVHKKMTWQNAIRSYGGSNLHVLTAGKTPENALQIFRSEQFSLNMEEWKKHYDCIVFDGPPFLGASESAYIAPMFQGVLIVVSCEQTRWELASLVKSKIEAVNGKVFGSILNRRKYYIPNFLYGIL